VTDVISEEKAVDDLLITLPPNSEVEFAEPVAPQKKNVFVYDLGGGFQYVLGSPDDIDVPHGYDQPRKD